MNTVLARHQMIMQQIRPWIVSEPQLIETLNDLARDRFVAEEYRHLAYADTEIPLPHGQKMMLPMIEGKLLQVLKIEPHHRVLEIGTGSGYVTACLGRLADTVTSIDIFEDLIGAAMTRLNDAGVTNATVRHMDATVELPDETYDAVAVCASMPRFDERFLDLLRPGGRMFVVVGDAPVMEARLITRVDGAAVKVDSLFETSIAALINASETPEFRF